MQNILISAMAVAITGLAITAQASEPSWPDLRDALYGDAALVPAEEAVRIDTPYRTQDDARTHIKAAVSAPGGSMIQSVTVILDENPMPVSAVFDLAQPRAEFAFDVTMRVNGPTPVHIVATTTDGRRLVSETFVKTSGTGACAAPPGTDPQMALATLGQMELDIAALGTAARLTARDRTLNVAVLHPSHSGLQMDQISLLFIPMRYVETLDVSVNGASFVTVTGSISFSENPQISLSIPAEAQSVSVTLSDTDGTVNTAQASVAGL